MMKEILRGIGVLPTNLTTFNALTAATASCVAPGVPGGSNGVDCGFLSDLGGLSEGGLAGAFHTVPTMAGDIGLRQQRLQVRVGQG